MPGEGGCRRGETRSLRTPDLQKCSASHRMSRRIPSPEPLFLRPKLDPLPRPPAPVAAAAQAPAGCGRQESAALPACGALRELPSSRCPHPGLSERRRLAQPSCPGTVPALGKRAFHESSRGREVRTAGFWSPLSKSAGSWNSGEPSAQEAAGMVPTCPWGGRPRKPARLLHPHPPPKSSTRAVGWSGAKSSLRPLGFLRVRSGEEGRQQPRVPRDCWAACTAKRPVESGRRVSKSAEGWRGAGQSWPEAQPPWKCLPRKACPAATSKEKHFHDTGNCSSLREKGARAHTLNASRIAEVCLFRVANQTGAGGGGEFFVQTRFPRK